MRRVTALLVLLVLLGCSRQVAGRPTEARSEPSGSVSVTRASGTSAPVRRAPAKPASHVVAAWTDRSFAPIGSLVSVRGGFVTYAFDRKTRRFEVLGLRASDGAVRWRASASPSNITPGVGLDVAAHGNTVVYQRPGAHPRDGTVSLVAVDGSTGHRLWTFGDGDLSIVDNAEFCNGNHQICLDTDDDYGTNSVVVLSALTGRIVRSRPIRGERTLGSELYDVRGGELARIRFSGAQVWSLPVRRLFPGPKVATNYGWIFVNDSQRYVGTLGAVVSRTGSTRVHQVPETTSAFRVSDGKRIWTRHGLAMSCNAAIEPSMRHLVGCQMVGGSITFSGAHTRYNHLQLVIEGLDPATGKTTWRWNAGGTDLLFGDHPLPRVGETRYLLVRHGRQYVLDTASGVRPFTGDAVGWCDDWTDVKPAVTTTWYPRAEQSYSAGDVRPCDAAGHHPAVPTSLPAFAVTRSGRVAAWSQADGVHAATTRTR